MPKNRYVPRVTDPYKDMCPRCLKKGKKVSRPGIKMAKHYRIKHPGKTLPDRFYMGPRDISGGPIPPYEGKFIVGARVRIIGEEKEFAALCEHCGAERPTEARMRKHLLKKHKIKHPTHPPRFAMDGERRQIEGEIEKGNSPIGMRGTVFDVTPAGFGGAKIPAIIHVRLDKPYRLKYYDKWAFSCVEDELKLLKPKVEDADA